MALPVDSSSSLFYANMTTVTAVAPLWAEYLFYDITREKFFGCTHLNLQNMVGVEVTYSLDGGATTATLAPFQTLVDDDVTARGIWLQSVAGSHTVKVRARNSSGRASV